MTTLNETSEQFAPQVVVPPLGIDLDGCVDEFPGFFQTLTHVWPGKVYVITFRDDPVRAKADLDRHGVRYDEVILVNSFDRKAEVIVEKGIQTYIDDQPEMLRNIPPHVNVMLMRNEGNYDFSDRRWTLSTQTGKLI